MQGCDRGEISGQFPGIEEEVPVDIGDDFFDGYVNTVTPRSGRCYGHMRFKTASDRTPAGLGERHRGHGAEALALTQGVILFFKFGNESLTGVRVEQTGGYQRVLRGVRHMDHRR